MTPTSRTDTPTTSTTTRTTAMTQHDSIRTRTTREPEPRATRSKASHLCIVINWSGPACGRDRATDERIEAAGGRSGGARC